MRRVVMMEIVISKLRGSERYRRGEGGERKRRRRENEGKKEEDQSGRMKDEQSNENLLARHEQEFTLNYYLIQIPLHLFCFVNDTFVQYHYIKSLIAA